MLTPNLKVWKTDFEGRIGYMYCLNADMKLCWSNWFQFDPELTEPVGSTIFYFMVRLMRSNFG